MDSRWLGRGALLLLGACFLVLLSFSKKGEKIRAAAFVAAWLLPGAGHAMLGAWRKGLFFFAILGATYLFGMWIAGFRPVSFDDNPFYFIGQFGSGATYLIAKLRGAEKAIMRDDLHPSWFDPGLLYVCVVGLLNIVVTINVLDVPIAAPAPAKAPEVAAAAAVPPPPPPPAPAPSQPVPPVPGTGA